MSFSSLGISITCVNILGFDLSSCQLPSLKPPRLLQACQRDPIFQYPNSPPYWSSEFQFINFSADAFTDLVCVHEKPARCLWALNELIQICETITLIMSGTQQPHHKCSLLLFLLLSSLSIHSKRIYRVP